MQATDVLTTLTALRCQVSPEGDTLHVLDPHHADRRGEPVARDVPGRPEGIARALHDQRRRADPLELRRAQPLGLLRRVEGVAEADEAARLHLVGEQARHAPAEGLASDHEARGAAELAEGVAPRGEQHGRAVERAAPALLATLRHVGELEARHADAARGELARHRREEGRVHRGAGSVGEHQRRAGVRRTVEEHGTWVAELRAACAPYSGPARLPMRRRGVRRPRNGAATGRVATRRREESS